MARLWPIAAFCNTICVMPILVFLLTLLVVPYWALMPLGVAESMRGRVGVAILFVLAGVGHFVKTEPMAQMLPPWVPWRVAIVYATGVFELLAGPALLVPALRVPVGVLLCVFVLLVLPANVYAALERLPLAGHEAGWDYLIVRIPLQFFLIGWIYWFAVRS